MADRYHQEMVVFSDLSEKMFYNFSGLKLHATQGCLSYFDTYAAACHWHRDLEFLIILEGQMDCYVNGTTVNIEKGQGIFVNSKRLHYGYSAKREDCRFIVITFHPSMITDGSDALQSSWDNIFSEAADDYILLSDHVDWQQRIIAACTALYEKAQTDSPNFFSLISLAAGICGEIADHIDTSKSSCLGTKDFLSLSKMTDYVHQNYDKRLTIENVAASGAVCRSTCCALFKRYIGQSPNVYLNGYRIQRSAELLRETAMSMSEISYSCGFSTPSYFTQLFKKEMGVLPNQYRVRASKAAVVSLGA